jgi:hypothetical protein
MIVFVALWLTSTVFLVILYTGQEEIRNENARLAKHNDRLITSTEDSSLELIREAKPGSAGGPTVVGILEENRAETAFLATGEEADDAETVRSKRDQLLEAIERVVPDPDAYADMSFYDALSTLYEAFKGGDALRRAAEKRAADLDTQVASLMQGNADQKNDFDARAKELTDELAQVRAERDANRADRDAAIEALRAEFDARRLQADADLTAERQQKATLERNLAEVQARFRAQQERFGGGSAGPGELSTARQPDGRVLTAIPGDEVVYVDLGRERGVTLGLQFSVYSAATGIPADGRGKAQIEVVSIYASSAECKIVRLAENEVILEDDLIANPVFDPERKLSFLVAGKFDLDHDGITDSDGAAVVDALVTNWGGVITTELTALTDFLILGGPPPRPGTGSDMSREQTEHADTMRREWDRYTELVATARSLSVPILTQDLLVNFLGSAVSSAHP